MTFNYINTKVRNIVDLGYILHLIHNIYNIVKIKSVTKWPTGTHDHGTIFSK